MTDTTDREMHEYAAKAAGVEIDPIDAAHDPREWQCWNPRHDNNDAFQLAARLKLQVAFCTFNKYEASAYAFGKPAVHVLSLENTDIEAAAREAIFLMAVEIGKGMK